MQTEPQVYELKVDNSGRIVFPADLRQQNHIAESDTIVVVKDDHGLHIKTVDQVIAEVQANSLSMFRAGCSSGMKYRTAC